MKHKIILCLIFSLIFLNFSFAPQHIKSYVIDRINLLTSVQKETLNSLYKKHDKKTTNEIALLIVDDFSSEPNLHDFSKKLFNEIGIGKKKKNNGLLIVYCSSCKKIEIITGTGTEKIITYYIAQKIINENFIPDFRRRKYFDGLRNGSKELIRLLEEPQNEIK